MLNIHMDINDYEIYEYMSNIHEWNVIILGKKYEKITSNKKTNKQTHHSFTASIWNFYNPPGPLPLIAASQQASGQSLFNTLMQAPRSVNFHTMDFIWVRFDSTEEIVGWFLSVLGGFLMEPFKKELCKHPKKTWT